MNDQHHMPEEKPRTLPEWVNFNLVGAALLVVALGWSLYNIYTIDRELENPNEIRVTVAHWQLELGYRDALNDVIEQYQRKVNGKYIGKYAKYNDNPELIPQETLAKADFLRKAQYEGSQYDGKIIRVVQMPVTEKVYSQWLNTRLASKEAATICEMGMATMTKSHKLISRFFQPLTEPALEPNHWNDGTSLEGVPWKDTFTDGMQGGYKAELQEFMSVPTTIYPLRIYYNEPLVKEGKSLLRQAILETIEGKAVTSSGVAPADWIVKKYQSAESDLDTWLQSAEAPRTFGEMIEIARQLRSMVDSKTKRNIIPIAGSGYGATDWFVDKYATSFMAHMEWDKQLDLNLDGKLDDIESFTAIKQGKFNLELPEVRSYWDTMRQLTETFGDGYLARDRQSAVFAFVQGRAAMLPTGAWDAETLFKQAERSFKVGVFNFPPIGEGEPGSEYFAGPVNEATDNGSGLYGVFKFAPDIEQEIGIDFLKYWTSVQGNTTFAGRAGLVAINEEAQTPERMKPFEPVLVGYSNSSAVRFNNWGSIKTDLKAMESAYLSGETEKFEKFRKEWRGVLKADADGTEKWKPALDQWQRALQGHVRDVKDRETVLSTIIMDEMSSARAARVLKDKLNSAELSEEEKAKLETDMKKAQAAREDARARYRETILDQILMNNGQDNLREFERVNDELNENGKRMHKATIDDLDAFGRTE